MQRGTDGEDYTDRLVRRSGVGWKSLLDVQRPYRWNLRRHQLGRTLEVGCGIGRNLAALGPGSVGVDHNPTSISIARGLGLDAVTTEEWNRLSGESPPFDSLLFAHVVEHMTFDEAGGLVNAYLPALRPGGKVLFICPQERGFASDPTHVSFTTGQDLQRLARSTGLIPGRWHSFPFPRVAGRLFTYNEFTLVATLPDGSSPVPRPQPPVA